MSGMESTGPVDPAQSVEKPYGTENPLQFVPGDETARLQDPGQQSPNKEQHGDNPVICDPASQFPHELISATYPR